jgi:hypothetical protein
MVGQHAPDSTVYVYKINEEEYLHFFVELNIHFISELPF